MKKVLFVCVHNAGRSQMAEAFFNKLAKGKSVAESAGTVPATGINPVVLQAMREVGIDIEDRKPRLLSLEMMETADRVITMGCMDEAVCPASFTPTEDWGLEDPSGKPIETVRRIRDEIKIRVETLLAELQSVANP